MESLVGERLGRFHIKRLIGRGGMGEVYAAVDESLDRDVAIKVLGSAADDDAQRKRFMREARLAAKLTHPNIASVFEVGESEGRLYIVMELLEGESLRTLLLSRRLSVEEAMSIGRDVARALARAHAAEIIHRDVKPENIFVTRPSPNVLFAKVLDFGLARTIVRRSTRDEETTSVDLTGPGEACGTAGYLAPGQARGLVVDVRADIFSFGAVMYEMLAGKRAFDGPNHLSRMLAVVKSTPEPLSVCAPGVPRELEAIVERCLAKAAADRYANGDELLADLERLERGSQRSLVDVSFRSDVAPDTVRDGGAPEPAASGPAMPVAHDSGGGKALSTVTPAPAVRNEQGASRQGRDRPLWPLLAAGGCVLVGTILAVIAIVTRPVQKPRATATASPSAAASEAPVQATAASAEEPTEAPPGGEEPADAEEVATQDEATSDGEDESSKPVTASTAPVSRPRPRPRPAASVASSAPSASASALAARSAAAPAPPPPAAPTTTAAPQPRYGTVRIQQSQIGVMVVVVDGEYRRVKDAMVVVPCGRRKIRVGFKEERIVDVPCGGVISL